MKRDYRRSGRGRKRSSLAQQLRQLGDVGGDAPGLVAGQPDSGRRGDYVGNRGECGSARLALETTFIEASAASFDLSDDALTAIAQRGAWQFHVQKIDPLGWRAEAHS